MAAFLTFLLAVVTTAQPRDLYLVRDARAEFYRDRRIQELRLEAGDVVEGEPHPVYRGWLRVVADGEPYDTQAQHFVARAALREEAARTQANLVSRIEQNSDRIEEARLRIAQLHAASAAIRFDGTVEFRTAKLVPVRPEGAAAGPPDGLPRRGGWPAPELQTVYDYQDKIPPRRAAGQAAKWIREIEDLEDSIRKWREARRQDVGLLAASQSEAEGAERRFRAYAATGASAAFRPHIVIEEKTDLFDGDRFVTSLQRDEVVLGRANRRHPRWLRLDAAGRLLDGRAKDFAARDTVEAEDHARVNQLDQLVDDLGDEIADLRAREQTLGALSIALVHESRLNRIPLAAYPIPSDYEGRAFYLGSLVPRDAAMLVNLSRARSLQRDWERARQDLADRIGKLRRRLESARRDLASASVQTEERRRRLRQADPAEAVGTPRIVLP